MRTLQIRNKKNIATYDMSNVKEVEINNSDYANKLSFNFGVLRPAIIINFEKSEEGWIQLKQVYNEVVSSIFLRDRSKSILIVNTNDYYVFESLEWQSLDKASCLILPIEEKKYNVSLNYGFNVDICVSATNEKEAYKKAKESVMSGERADEINDAVSVANEIEYFVNELDNEQ